MTVSSSDDTHTHTEKERHTWTSLGYSRSYLAELMGHLDRLRVMSTTETFGERDELLNSFVKQGYLHRVKLADDAGIEGGPSFEYYWGPRAKAEVSEEQIVDFIASVSYSLGRGRDRKDSICMCVCVYLVL